MAIHRLEQELGVTFFERNARAVGVMADGERVLQRLSLTPQVLAAARQALTVLNQLAVGEVRLRFAPMFGMGRLPLWLEQFHQRYLRVRFKALEDGSQEVDWRPESREIDIALMNARRVKTTWHSAVVDADELIIGVSPADPLAQLEVITAADLDGQPTVLLDDRFAQRMMLDECCKAHTHLTVLQNNDSPLALKTAQRRLGATTAFRSNLHASGGLIGIPLDRPQHLQFSLCCRADESLSLANKRLIEFVTGTALPRDARP